MTTRDDDDRIEYVRLPTLVRWTIFRPVGYRGTTNGAESNMRRARRAARHALRMVDAWQVDPLSAPGSARNDETRRHE